MSKFILDVFIVLIIVSIGGFFAAAEMALVSLREGQVRELAKRGKRGHKAARLANDPPRFFSAVQIGVTMATLISGAYAAATLAEVVKSWLVVTIGMAPSWASPVSYVIVTACITFVSLVLGELAPKRIALQRQTRVALLAAPMLDRLATVVSPVVWLLTKSANLVVAVFGGDPNVGRTAMTEQELRETLAGAQTLSQDERQIVGEVFDAGKRQIREVLIPRTEVVFLDAETPLKAAATIAVDAPYSRLPVFQESYDNVIGFVHVRDLLAPDALTGRGAVSVGKISRPVKFLPISKTVLSAMSEMRREHAHLAIVVDDYGGTAGIVTLEDLVEELIGDIRDEYDTETAETVQAPGGAVEVDGLLNLDEFREQTGVDLPEGPYETAAGYVLAALGDLPKTGDEVRIGGRSLTVTELDGRRIARLRVGPLVAAKPPVDSPSAG
ncbi:MAG TPA: hemolysin family protein [Streptosporangiaceae bacterium]|nr:hemolysin family protein [Streptosporangiaceae bacterium]